MFGGLEESILHVLKQSLSHGGHFVLFLTSMFETSPFLGVIIPGQTLMIFGGLLAKSQVLNIYIVYIVALIGVLIGDTLSYILGRTYGYQLLLRMGRFFSIQEIHFEKAKQALHNHVGKTLILSRFHPVTRSFIGFLSGCGHVPVHAFILYGIGGALLWVSMAVWGGYLFGSVIETVLVYGGSTAIVLVGILFGVWMMYHLMRKFHLSYKDVSLRYIGFGAILVSLCILVGYVGAVRGFEYLTTLDTYVGIAMLSSFGFAHLALVITTIFGTAGAGIIIVLVSVLWGLRYKLWDQAVIILLVGLGAPVISMGIKYFVERDRPLWAITQHLGYSFPSNHATFIVAVCLIVYLLQKHNKHNTRCVAYTLLSLVAIVFWSRLALGHHFFTDVLAGGVLGAGIACIGYGMYVAYKKYRTVRHSLKITV